MPLKICRWGLGFCGCTGIIVAAHQVRLSGFSMQNSLWKRPELVFTASSLLELTAALDDGQTFFITDDSQQEKLQKLPWLRVIDSNCARNIEAIMAVSGKAARYVGVGGLCRPRCGTGLRSRCRPTAFADSDISIDLVYQCRPQRAQIRRKIQGQQNPGP